VIITACGDLFTTWAVVPSQTTLGRLLAAPTEVGRPPHVFVLAALLFSFSAMGLSVTRSTMAVAAAQAKEKASSKDTLTKDARLAFIRKAQIWMPTTIPKMDFRAGPRGPGAFQLNEMVTCDYVDTKWPGTARKFYCATGDREVVKVRYGQHNGEVEGAVLATRLLWALGFGADRVYPVRVTCRGCSSDPWEKRERMPGEQLFDPAVIERKPYGHEMRENKKKAGWAWSALDLVDENQGGAPREQREALKLLAVLMQHTDTKPYQQRLLCLPGGMASGECVKPFMMLHDVGLTFGRANVFNHAARASVNFDEWSTTPIWRNAAQCVGHLSKSHTGTLRDPRISEAGRRFLADLLVQLTDRQLHDLFEVAGVERRSRRPASAEPPASAEQWVAAFKHKREEIVRNRCEP
jgi:hypothetical protein